MRKIVMMMRKITNINHVITGNLSGSALANRSSNPNSPIVIARVFVKAEPIVKIIPFSKYDMIIRF